MKVYYLLTILILFFCVDADARRRGVDEARRSRNIDRASKEAERRAQSARRKAAEEKKRAEQARQRKAALDRQRKARESARKASDESARKYMELQRLKKENAAKNPQSRVPVRNITYKEPVKVQTLPTEFKDRATAEIKPYLRSVITPLTLANKVKVDFPAKEPTEELESIRKRIDALVLEKVDKAFPPSTKNVHYNKALERYPLYEKGDMVEGLRIRPAGRNAVISGKFQGINRQGQLVIGSYEVPKVDMTESVMVYFDEALNDKKIEVYMANKLFYYYEDRAKMKEKLLIELQSAPLNKAGYFELDGTFYAGNEYIKALYKKESTEIIENVYEIVKERLLAKYDFKSSSLNNEEVFSDIKAYVSEEVAKLPKLQKPSLFSQDFYK